MRHVMKPFASLFVDSLEVSFAAHTVIALRMARFATAHEDSGSETRLMIAEKFDAAAEAAGEGSGRGVADGPTSMPGKIVSIDRKFWFRSSSVQNRMRAA